MTAAGDNATTSSAVAERVNQPGLARRLNVWSASLAGIGVILGAGIYGLIGPAAGEAGNAVWLSFLVAALIAGMTAFSYARFVRLRPKNSPEFQYVSMVFGPVLGFAAGWLMIWSDLVSIAAVALSFAGYLASLVPVPLIGGAAMLLAMLAFITWWGIGESIALVVFFTLIEAGGLVFIAVVGVPHWADVSLFEAPRGLGGVWAAAALVFFAYLGFDELGNLAEESKNPTTTLPKAIAAAFVVSTLIYVAVAVSAVSVGGWEPVAASNAPLATVAGTVVGPRTGQVLTYVALTATGNTVLLLLIAASRSLHGMAASGVLPSGIAQVGRRQTPLTAIILSLVVAGGFVLIGKFETVARLTNATVLVSFAAVNFSLFVLTLREQGIRNGGRTPWLWLPAVATVSCLWLLWYTGPAATGVAIALAIAGVIVGTGLRKRAGLRAGDRAKRNS
ncbi:MAG: amino acid permease [Chloroflexi bacterium]|nr:amino acid permease [Chloroflexota bacterium]